MRKLFLVLLLITPVYALADDCSCNAVESFGSDLLLESNPYGSGVIIRPSQLSLAEWRFSYDGKITPPREFQRYYIPWPEDLGGYEDLRAVDPKFATPEDNARVLNTLIRDLIDMGVLQEP